MQKAIEFFFPNAQSRGTILDFERKQMKEYNSITMEEIKSYNHNHHSY